MIEQILKNLKYLRLEQKDTLTQLLQKNADANEYFNSTINNIFNEWHEEHKCFDIPSGIVSICINGNIKYYPFGKTKYTKDNIFDIASMTKLYTEMMIFDFMDDYGFNFKTKIKDMVDFYDDIKELTIMDLLSFNNEFKTKYDVRECHNKKEAINALRTAYIEPKKTGIYKYTDLPSMILTDIMETITKKEYKELFNKYIIDKYKLNETYLEVDSNKYITLNKGLTNDPKANIMGGYYGHCGIKTTPTDFLKFFSTVLSHKHNKLFTTLSKTLKDDGTLCVNKALIGNSNLPVLIGNTLASAYVTKDGFAIQGSVRCHGETSNYVINGKEYRITSSLFMDLYTQYDNVKKYEKETGKTISKEYDADIRKGLLMTDIRTIIPYTGAFKKLTNLVGTVSALELYNILKKDYDL
jgi:hypothetical protein